MRLCKASYALFSKRFIGAIIGRNLCVPKLYKREALEFIEKLIGRSERIRTSDPLLPNKRVNLRRSALRAGIFCQTARNDDPSSASNSDPHFRRAFAPLTPVIAWVCEPG